MDIEGTKGELVFAEGFPKELNRAYLHAVSVISTRTVNNVPCGVLDEYNSDQEIYYLTDGSKIRFPYRICFEDDDPAYHDLDGLEKSIYDCIFTRHCDGRIREKHLKNLLAAGIHEWFMPYILRLSSEYVVEIIEIIYEAIKGIDNRMIQDFCRSNPVLLKRAYTRMGSYWECYYKYQYPMFADYVGKKLFEECFFPAKNFEQSGITEEYRAGDFGELDYSGDTVTYIYKGKTYLLTSHPYEPCLYIWEKDLQVCTLHNAYNTDDLKKAFSVGETVSTNYAKDYDKEFDEAGLCRVLAAALDSGRDEMDLFDAAKLAKEGFR